MAQPGQYEGFRFRHKVGLVPNLWLQEYVLIRTRFFPLGPILMPLFWGNPKMLSESSNYCVKLSKMFGTRNKWNIGRLEMVCQIDFFQWHGFGISHSSNELFGFSHDMMTKIKVCNHVRKRHNRTEGIGIRHKVGITMAEQIFEANRDTAWNIVVYPY